MVISKEWKIIIVLLLLIVLLIMAFFIAVSLRPKSQPQYIQLYDTIVDTRTVEIIKDKIVEQEKEIVKYKTEYIYEKEKANNVNDSAAIELFYKLTSE